MISLITIIVSVKYLVYGQVARDKLKILEFESKKYVFITPQDIVAITTITVILSMDRVRPCLESASVNDQEKKEEMQQRQRVPCQPLSRQYLHSSIHNLLIPCMCIG